LLQNELLLHGHVPDLLDLVLDLLVVVGQEPGGEAAEDVDVAVGLAVDVVQQLPGLGLVLLALACVKRLLFS